MGRSICGGIFYPDEGNFPSEWRGKFFHVDWAANWVKALDVDNPGEVQTFAKDFDAPVWLEAHPDGSLWILNRGTIWRDGKRYKENAGSLVRIRHIGALEGGSKTKAFPETLSATGLFQHLSPLKPFAGLVEFKMNAPVWNPGVVLRNWMRIPDGRKIRFSKDDDWVFPEGSVLVQHFDSVAGQAHETHVYWARGDGKFRSAAYAWGQTSGDAHLVTTSSVVTVPGSGGVQWFSPGPEPMLNPELAVVGFIPQFNTRQLNGGDQLSIWSNRGYLDTKISESEQAALPQLADLFDERAPVGRRVLSSRDANCAVCQHPGGPSRGYFDSRYSTPLADQEIVNGALMAGDMGIEGARIVVPGVPEKSILYQRLKRDDFFRMPPISVHGEKPPVLPLLEEWILNLDTAE